MVLTTYPAMVLEKVWEELEEERKKLKLQGCYSEIRRTMFESSATAGHAPGAMPMSMA